MGLFFDSLEQGRRFQEVWALGGGGGGGGPGGGLGTHISHMHN